MRGLLTCLVVGLVAAVPAMGQAERYHATFSISTPGAVYNPVSEMNEILFEDLAGPNFYVDISIDSTDPSGMSAFGITLTSNCPIEHLAMESYFGNALNYQGSYASYSTRGGVDRNWSMATPADAILIPAGTLPMDGPLVLEEISTINETGTFALNGLAVWMEMVKPLDPVDCIIDARYGIVGNPDYVPYVGQSDFQPHSVSVIPLHVIVPEPMGALLLLAGLPLLRRRR
jgi:hypothetical protein